MNGNTNLSAGSRHSHFKGGLPNAPTGLVPRNGLQSRPQSPGVSPKLPARQHSQSPRPNSPLNFGGTRKASSPRGGKMQASSSGLTEKELKLKSPPKATTVQRTTVSAGQVKQDFSSSGSAMLNSSGFSGNSGSGSACSSPRLQKKGISLAGNSSTGHIGCEKTASQEPGVEMATEGYRNERSSHWNHSSRKSLCSQNDGRTMNRATSQAVQEMIGFLQWGKHNSRFSLCAESLLARPIAGDRPKRPQSCPVKGEGPPEVDWRSCYGLSNPPASEREDKPKNEAESNLGQPHVATMFSPPGKATDINTSVKLPSMTLQSHPLMAAVAPFRYSKQKSEREGEDFSAENSDGSSPSETVEFCCRQTDPESQRKRTVQNVLDLRQNLEETMSSLRGSQLTHSSLETSCYDSDEANPRSMSSLSNRSSPISWRYGQSSPRLQAGDAPSVGGGCRTEGSSAWYMQSDKAHYAHTMPMRSPSKLSHISRLELIDSLDPEDADLKSGYMSDSDILGKTINDDDDITTGWDESSSISSGLSDASDNLSSEEFNAGSSLNSLPTTPVASRRNSTIALKTDAEKRSLVESGLSWYGESEGKALKKGEYESGSLKADQGTKWRRERPENLEESGKGELKKPQSLGQPGSLRKGKTPPVGVTSPITHTAQNSLKVAGKTEVKPSEKGKLTVKATGLQRSSSDAGRDRSAEARKPPSGLIRPSTGGSFGYKKPPPATGTATVMTGGTSLKSGSVTLSKIQKSSGIPVKPINVRKTSLDVSNAVEPGFLSPGARSTIQYRSLPRPAKSSAMSVTGGRAGTRPMSSSIDPSMLSAKQTSVSISRLKEPSRIGSGRSAPAPVNQTDREKEKAKAKAVASDSECNSLKSSSVSENSSKIQSMRQPTAKITDSSSPTPHRVLGSKAIGKPPSLAHLDKVNSNSLDLPSSGQSVDIVHSPYSKLQDVHPSTASMPTHMAPCLTPSPAPVLNINSSSFSQGLSMTGSFSDTPETLMYPKLSGLHRSMESLPLPMSVSSPFSGTSATMARDEDQVGISWTGSIRTPSTDSFQRARNTLPKKGLRYTSSQSQEETKERRHSHTIGELQEPESQSQLPTPLPTPLSSVGKGPLLTNVVSPTTSSTPRMTRSNSIPTHDSAFELYSTSQMGSTLSLAERPKGMVRSGSFRDPVDDVHGSMLSLASSASSSYSSAEEKMQSEQIRKLRRELESSQEKVATLTSQLSANANLVAAFEQSLANMTSRLQSLTMTAEEKDSELYELRETIEILKKKNAEAQAVIQGALNTPEITPKELRIKRQNSSDSISSLNSITSHSSIGSSKDSDPKKKKKKSWLRSSFNKAFSIKKGPKSATSYSDIEEIATPDSSAPSSPKLLHDAAETTSPSIKSSNSSSVIFECNEEAESEEKVVSELRTELWEKEMKLTDIRLEALSSAHQLDQLRETMHNMQMEVEVLKAENDRLKTGTPPNTSQPEVQGTPSSATSSPRRSLGLSLPHSFSLSLTESTDTDMMPLEAITSSLQKDEGTLKVLVRIPEQHLFKEEMKQHDFFIGSARVTGKTDWKMLDALICQIFKDYITKVDPASSLGLSSESIYSYNVSHMKRVLDSEAPDLLPSRYIGRGTSCISVTLKGLKDKCVDNLVFETLIPKPMMQHYISLLLKHRRLILSGPSGTGKTYLTNRLSEYLVERSGRDVTDGIIMTFNMHEQSCKDLQLYLSNLANQIDRETGTGDVPLVIILDDLNEPGSISDLVNGALTCKYHKCPYIIGTTNQSVKMTPNHGLHLSFRMVTFSNNVEPANGFLVRYLHRKLIESEIETSTSMEELLRVLDWVPKLWYHLHTFLEKHSTSDFLIGPCFFLSCPVSVEEFQDWFIDLWNHSIIPYLQEGAKDGIKVHGQKAAWEDPVEWVRGTLPWPSAQQDQAKLFHLPPPSVAAHLTAPPTDERASKDTTPGSLESDPLMAMLLKLQESANYIESPDRETNLDSNLQSTH
nr:PREDICTED: neuron navigator 1 isoform X3 [Latimeria chalumnae]|eukprot:XP_014343598.1 PREDICTED: neuron navigator 1 isoform X3 [Latimeria chalumnae]